MTLEWTFHREMTQARHQGQRPLVFKSRKSKAEPVMCVAAWYMAPLRRKPIPLSVEVPFNMSLYRTGCIADNVAYPQRTKLRPQRAFLVPGAIPLLTPKLALWLGTDLRSRSFTVGP